MKLIASILLTALLAFAIGLFELPWWMFSITTFIVFVSIPQTASKSFVVGFATIFVLWLLLAAKLDFDNDHLLSKKVADILMLKGNYWLLLLITAFVGALVAGMSALTGSLARSSFSKKKRTNR